jgi:hypothetical protein
MRGNLAYISFVSQNVAGLALMHCDEPLDFMKAIAERPDVVLRSGNSWDNADGEPVTIRDNVQFQGRVGPWLPDLDRVWGVGVRRWADWQTRWTGNSGTSGVQWRASPAVSRGRSPFILLALFCLIM